MSEPDETIDAPVYQPPRQTGGSGLGRRLLLPGIFTALLMVLTVILIVPAVNRHRLSQNEFAAIVALRGYANAQVLYRREARKSRDGKPCYADKLAKLGELLPKGMADAWGAGGKPYHGYLFQEIKTIGGQPVQWADDYACCAIPARHGQSGVRTFILATNGTIFPKDRGPGGGFVDDYPGTIEELAKGGWCEAGYNPYGPVAE
jgi:hypothetical protein